MIALHVSVTERCIFCGVPEKITRAVHFPFGNFPFLTLAARPYLRNTLENCDLYHFAYIPYMEYDKLSLYSTIYPWE